MIHLTSEGFASRGGSALLSLPFCGFGWQKLLFSSLLCFPTCLILWGALAPGKWCGQEGRGWHHWEPSLCLSLMLHQLLVGREPPPRVIAMDLVSGDVLQRINAFMGFLSLCCKKQGSIPGRRGLPKERHISSLSPWLVLQPRSEVQVVCETPQLLAETQPFLQYRH